MSRTTEDNAPSIPQQQQAERKPIPHFPMKPPLPAVAAQAQQQQQHDDLLTLSKQHQRHKSSVNSEATTTTTTVTTTGDGVFLKRNGAQLVEEDDEGSVEYKWRLVGISAQRLNHLVTQMKFRVAEGRGECMYEIGVEDDGYTRGLPPAEFDESIATLKTMAARLGFTLEVTCVVSKPNPAGPEGSVLKCAEVRVRKIVQMLPTCRIAIIGDTNAGKSTLVGVIASGALDDGSGTVRQSVFNHKHELESGQTSSVCDRIVGFSKDGKIVNYSGGENSADGCNSLVGSGEPSSAAEAAAETRNTSNDLTERSATLTMLMDLPGHLKRSHTALSAIVGRFPHVVAVVVDPANPANAQTHIAQCAALQLPFFVIFTHQDSAQPHMLGHAATVVDKSVGAETGKRLIMVSAPILPGESDGGFLNREMIHASSDMFLSDLCSTDGGGGSQMGSPRKSDVAGNQSDRDNDDDDDNNNNNNGADGDGSDGEQASTPQHRGGGGGNVATAGSKTPAGASNKPGFLSGAGARNPVEAYLNTHVPVFIVSSVSGYGIPLLKHFLHQLSLSPPRLTVDECEPMVNMFPSAPPTPAPTPASVNNKMRQGMSNDRGDGDDDDDNVNATTTTAAGALFPRAPTAAGAAAAATAANEPPDQLIRLVIGKVFNVAKVGVVATGTVTSGTLKVGQHLYWGPSKSGAFHPVQVSSLHYQRNFVRSVGSGNEIAVAFEKGDQLPPEVLAMSQRKGTMLYGSEKGSVLPPSTSRDFRVLVTKVAALKTAESWSIDQELTAFVFSAKQAAFLRKVEPVDFASEAYAAVRAARQVGDADRPLIMHCSFVCSPEVLAVGAPIVLLRNTPDGRLKAVGGRILSFDACVRAKESESGSSGSATPRSNVTSPVTVNHGAAKKTTTSGGNSNSTPTCRTTPPTPTTRKETTSSTSNSNIKQQHADPSSPPNTVSSCNTDHSRNSATDGDNDGCGCGDAGKGNSSMMESKQNSAQFPLVTLDVQTLTAVPTAAPMMKKPTSSSPPLTPTTNPPEKRPGAGITLLDLAQQRHGALGIAEAHHHRRHSGDLATSSTSSDIDDSNSNTCDSGMMPSGSSSGDAVGAAPGVAALKEAPSAAELSVAAQRAQRKRARVATKTTAGNQ